MRKIILFIGIFAFVMSNTNGQSKYGTDSLACLENRTLYYQNYQQKNYIDALRYWRNAFLLCPASSENLFRHGPKIIKAKMKLDKQNKSAYIDTLMTIFDQRIQYFGKEGYVLGLKGYELLISDKKRSDIALEYLTKSISIEGNKSGAQVCWAYLKAIENLYKKDVKTEGDILEAYSLIMPIFNYNINNESKSTKYYIQYLPKIEKIFSNYANCNDLISLFSKQHVEDAKNWNNIEFYTRATDQLKKGGCTENDLFFTLSKNLHKLSPSALSTSSMGKMSIYKKQYKNAIDYFNQAIELADEELNKSRYYLGLADAYRNSGAYSSARNAVYKALELNPESGEAHMSLGNIYVAGAKSCGNGFDKNAVYWVAVDAFRKALKDEKTNKAASKSINTYSKYFPNKETCFFNNVEPGKKYLVECWINQSTTVRTSD